MPIGNLGILLSITFFGAMISQVTLVPLADKFGRKITFELSLLVMIVASAFSVRILYCREYDINYAVKNHGLICSRGDSLFINLLTYAEHL